MAIFLNLFYFMYILVILTSFTSFIVIQIYYMVCHTNKLLFDLFGAWTYAIDYQILVGLLGKNATLHYELYLTYVCSNILMIRRRKIPTFLQRALS